MAIVSLALNGRSYQVSCDPGQEERLQLLAKYVDERIRNKIPAGTDEHRSLLLISLILADELVEAKTRMLDIEEDAIPASEQQSREAKLTEEINSLASRIERLVQSINPS